MLPLRSTSATHIAVALDTGNPTIAAHEG